MPKKNKNLDFTAVRKDFQNHIDLWLQEAAKAEEKMKSFAIGSVRWDSASDDRGQYRSMAHALVMLGRRIGVIAEDEYPQFPE